MIPRSPSHLPDLYHLHITGDYLLTTQNHHHAITLPSPNSGHIQSAINAGQQVNLRKFVEKNDGNGMELKEADVVLMDLQLFCSIGESYDQKSPLIPVIFFQKKPVESIWFEKWGCAVFRSKIYFLIGLIYDRRRRFLRWRRDKLCTNVSQMKVKGKGVLYISIRVSFNKNR